MNTTKPLTHLKNRRIILAIAMVIVISSTALLYYFYIESSKPNVRIKICLGMINGYVLYPNIVNGQNISVYPVDEYRIKNGLGDVSTEIRNGVEYLNISSNGDEITILLEAKEEYVYASTFHFAGTTQTIINGTTYSGISIYNSGNNNLYSFGIINVYLGNGGYDEIATPPVKLNNGWNSVPILTNGIRV